MVKKENGRCQLQLRRSSRVAPAATVVARTQPSRIIAAASHCQPPRSCQSPTWPRSITGSSRSRAKSEAFHGGCSPLLTGGWLACAKATERRRPQHRHPQGGPAGPVPVGDRPVLRVAPQLGRERQGLAAAALLGEQHLAGVLVLTAVAQHGGQPLVRLRAYSAVAAATHSSRRVSGKAPCGTRFSYAEAAHVQVARARPAAPPGRRG